MPKPLEPLAVCPFCLAEETASVAFDRRSKPYLRCVACGARAFLHSLRALNGIAVAQPVLAGMVDRMRVDRAMHDATIKQIEAFIAPLKEAFAVASASTARPAVTTAASMVQPTAVTSGGNR